MLEQSRRAGGTLGTTPRATILGPADCLACRSAGSRRTRVRCGGCRRAVAAVRPGSGCSLAAAPGCRCFSRWLSAGVRPRWSRLPERRASWVIAAGAGLCRRERPGSCCSASRSCWAFRFSKPVPPLDALWLHRRPQLPTALADAQAAHGDHDPGPEAEPGKPPDLPHEFPTRLADGVADARNRSLKILVIGESSGRGEPYHPWVSVGQIVAWRLDHVFPGRIIDVDIWATGGADARNNA